ncbi:putative bifunctional diguanylate cyclase/phosphodiesterase [Burkholderiaceae bacterium UC74_6]
MNADNLPVPESDPEPAGGEEQALRSHRIVQLARLVFAGLFAASLATGLKGDWFTTAMLGGAFASVAFSVVLNHIGLVEAASMLLLWTLTLLATAAMWFNQGIYSPAILVYPCILVTANMLGRTRNFILQLLFMLAATACMAWASETGLREFDMTPVGWSHFTYVAVILTTCGLMIYMLAGDLRSALSRLRSEVRRASEATEQIRYQALHDALTGLPNRVAALSVAQAAMAHAARHGRQVGFVFVNIDNFKQINESLGHSVGDELLRQIGMRLKEHMRRYDAVTRYGGDEFLLLASDLGDSEEAAAVASHVLGHVSETFRFAGMTVAVSCSIGVAMFPGDGQDFETLLQKADVAVHHAKDAGRNVFRFFDERMNANMLEDLNISTGLRQAVARSELRLNYQPLLDLTTGRLLGAEALLRWTHPERGNIPPGRFIPVAERSGQVVELGEWVLDEACRQLRAWRGSPFEGLTISVNVSTVQFKRGTLEAVVAQALDKHGVPPGSLELEVTESALIHDPEGFVETLHGLKRLGVRLSIDDFGTGYSNLSYLQRFEVDKLKIDQSFVRRLGERESDRAIVRAIIQMAKSLNLVTTGEGIENETTRSLLVEMGCDQGQGYALGRPQPVERFQVEFAPLLSSAGSKDATATL